MITSGNRMTDATEKKTNKIFKVVNNNIGTHTFF